MSTSPKPVMYRVGRRRWWPQWRAHGAALWTRWRYPGTRRTLLRLSGHFNPKDLGAELKVVDKRPLFWVAGLIALALIPPAAGVALVVWGVGCSRSSSSRGVWVAVTLSEVRLTGKCGKTKISFSPWFDLPILLDLAEN